MGVYSSRYLQSIQEVYFGETNGIQAIQKQLSKFRASHMGNKFDMDINIDPELFKLNRLFEEEFGFEVFTLKIINESAFNAFTIPIGARIDSGTTGDALVSKKDGFKYDVKAGYACIVGIYSGVICNSDFTDREVMAIILHEVGHNFSSAVNSRIGIMENVYKILVGLQIIIMTIIAPALGLGMLYGAILTGNSYLKGLIDFDKSLKSKNKSLDHCLRSMWNVFGIVKSFMGEIMFVKKLVLTPLIVPLYADIFANIVKNNVMLALNPAMLFRKLYGYQDEQFSDQFATLYGYGPDLTSGLAKLEFSGHGSILADKFNQIPVISQLVNLIWLPIDIMASVFDVHPVAPARLRSELVLLEAELKKDSLDPKMKARIIQDVNKLHKAYDNYIDATKALPTDPFIFKKIYYSWLYKKVGGDMKNLIFDAKNPDEMDRTYRKLK